MSTFVNSKEVKFQIEAFRGAPGPAGPAGPIGPTGAQGPRGLTGPVGAIGPKGEKGDKGDKGDRGETGLTGATGPQGATGPKGSDGAPGATGPVGPAGPAGADGKDGETGPQGPAGADGQAATLEIVDADSLAYGSKPTVTEEAGSTPQARKYRLGIPEGKPGTNGTGNGGSVEIDTTLTQYGQAADAGAVGNAIDQEKQEREQAVNELKEAIDNKVGTDELNAAVEDALIEAKNSGEFDGPIGPQGPAGNDGETPEKGVDYWTEADKAEIVSDVLAALPNASGVSF